MEGNSARPGDISDGFPRGRPTQSRTGKARSSLDLADRGGGVMSIFGWWKNPQTLNQNIAKGLVAGILIGSVVFVVITIAFDRLIEKIPSEVCRESNVFGSSAWVACVDKLILERKP
ncbi:hypothetical protein ACI2KS_10205 [Pseudomonas sp. NPDC087358]|uniref:hypothetical protein n=1 Tax=Pseudomonas sp. NPDC087358 TaxID=3364439 RepID=UPI00384BA3EF